MPPVARPLQVGVGPILDDFLRGIARVVPDLLAALLFLVVAFVVIRVVRAAVREVAGRVYPAEVVVDLVVTLAGVVLWFGAALVVLSILGLGAIAASLGTAAGFVGLGIAYALSDMLADVVAGVYLVRDPDFTVGDAVETADATGEVADVSLRKSRLTLEGGDTLVLANHDVERRWTKLADRGDDVESTAEAGNAGGTGVSGDAGNGTDEGAA